MSNESKLSLDDLIEDLRMYGWWAGMGRLELQVLDRALTLFEGNRARIAREFRMNRTTLVEKLRKYGLDGEMKVEAIDLATEFPKPDTSGHRPWEDFK